MKIETRREIERLVARLLRDSGITEPPVPIERVLHHLELHRDFFDLQDPGLLRRAEYRLKVGAEQLSLLFRERVKLAAIWLPDENRILIDRSLHAAKQNWASFHDTIHSALPWHRPFFLGDTAQTLNPDYQEKLEAEANYGASALLFCGARFTQDACDIAPEWSSIPGLQKRYSASLVSTLRRYVEHGPDLAMVMVVSTPWWISVSPDQPHRCRHLISSPRFTREFGRLDGDEAVELIESHTAYQRGGPVGDFEIGIKNGRGELHEFRGENFFNRYDILTLIVQKQRVSTHSLLVRR